MKLTPFLLTTLAAIAAPAAAHAEKPTNAEAVSTARIWLDGVARKNVSAFTPVSAYPLYADLDFQAVELCTWNDAKAAEACLDAGSGLPSVFPLDDAKLTLRVVTAAKAKKLLAAPGRASIVDRRRIKADQARLKKLGKEGAQLVVATFDDPGGQAKVLVAVTKAAGAPRVAAAFHYDLMVEDNEP